MVNSNYRDRCLEAKGEQCKFCDSTQNVVVHHVDGDRDNNALENLIPVCRSCHNKIHGNNPELREWWEKLGIENPPAFPYSEAEKRPLYVRPETRAKFDDAIQLQSERILREGGIRNAQKREYYDAMLCIAAEHPELVADQLIQTRRDS